MQDTIQRQAIRLRAEYGECDDCGILSATPGAACPSCREPMERRMGPGVSPLRSTPKAEATVFGKLLTAAGVVMLLAPPVLLGGVIFRGQDLTLVLLALLLVSALPGLAVFFVAASMISREAAPALGRLGDLVIAGLKVVFRVRNEGGA